MLIYFSAEQMTVENENDKDKKDRKKGAKNQLGPDVTQTRNSHSNDSATLGWGQSDKYFLHNCVHFRL
jgi:hypothetical protein